MSKSTLRTSFVAETCLCQMSFGKNRLSPSLCSQKWRNEMAARRDEHGMEVITLLPRNTKVVTLLVGESEFPFIARPIVLGFFSKFFDRLFYGPFIESSLAKISSPDDDPHHVEAYIAWAYTGLIINPRKLKPERLWQFGRRLLSPAFCNAAMALLFAEDYFTYRARTAEDASWILEMLESKTALYKFFHRQVSSGGPPDMTGIGNGINPLCNEWVFREPPRPGEDVPSEFEKAWVKHSGEVLRWWKRKRRSNIPSLCSKFDHYLIPELDISVDNYQVKEDVEAPMANLLPSP